VHCTVSTHTTHSLAPVRHKPTLWTLSNYVWTLSNNVWTLSNNVWTLSNNVWTLSNNVWTLLKRIERLGCSWAGYPFYS